MNGCTHPIAPQKAMTNFSADSSNQPLLNPIDVSARQVASSRRNRPPTPTFRRSPTENDATTAMTIAISKKPDDPWGQLTVFFKSFRIPVAQGRERSVSMATETKYVQAITLFMETLADKNMRIRNLSEMSQKHLVLVMQEWEARKLSAGTLSTRFSCIARFYGWLGKNLTVKSVKDTLLDPEAGKRSFSAVVPKAWDKVGVDMARLLPQVEALCPYSAVYLVLAREFGLRVQEAAALRPVENDMGSYLSITHGAKGGRGRAIPIDTPVQRRALEIAKAAAHPRTGLLRASGKTIHQSIAAFYRVMNKVGITRKHMGVTAHGLRHEYANSIYAAHAGVDAPVNGGLAPDRQTELKARKVVTENLGHGRLSVTTAYTGSHANIERHELKRMHQVLDVLQAPGAELGRFVQAKAVELNATHRAENPTAAELELRVYVIGPEAEGKGPHYMPLMLAIRICDRSGMDIPGFLGPLQDIITKLSPLVRQQTGRMCLVNDARVLPADTSQLEILLR